MSVLKFNSVDVLESIFIKKESDVPGQIDIFDNFNCKIISGHKMLSENSIRVKLGISSGDQNLEENEYYLKIVITGDFSIKKDTNEHDSETLDRILKQNTIAILYPYVRSIASDITSKGSIIPLIIPPINVAAMIEESEVAES